ncbi:phosphatidylinositol glycan anchor biosynthesis class W a isoform X1 [Musca autumnalis]|uniref:phosphatidylinositol glycan anchor biosynthesis class W a isoform X1 n=1 Tax=Musca autumnalis TaxID=221902 RepID=UPI003CE99B05
MKENTSLDPTNDCGNKYYNCQSHDEHYCNAEATAYDCLSLAQELLACRRFHDQQQQSMQSVCGGPTSTMVGNEQNDTSHRMDIYEKHSEETLVRIWHIQSTIIVTLIAIVLARVVVRHTLVARHHINGGGGGGGISAWFKVYILEFIVISLPAIVSVNILNKWVEHILAIAIIVVIAIVWQSRCTERAKERLYEFGRRPITFTLLRSTISLLTALCILAIDFESFPKKFRKTRRYGVGLMDVGIGLFVFSMALVSPRSKRLMDLRKMFFTVACMLVLGLARTIVITSIDYHQDEHEYGMHLNAFFTLGLTKLFATLLGFMARNDKHLLPMGVVILVLHEVGLQCGISSYVMDPDLERTNFLAANREGICSLPGFIALYLLSQYIGQWIKSKDILNYQEIKQKLIHLTSFGVVLWLIVIGSVMLIGIARVTCNLGYVTWMLAIAVTMCALYLFVFDIVLDTLLPVNKDPILETPSEKSVLPFASNTKIPTIIEAINYNGLVYFLLGNVLTGGVNIFLNTDERSDTESVVILMGYMFLTSLVVSLLYRYKIRIA